MLDYFPRLWPRNQRADEQAAVATGSNPRLPPRDAALRSIIGDADLLDTFRGRRQLPFGYALRLDSRFVELPWVLSRLAVAQARSLDVGGTLRDRLLVERPEIACRTIYDLHLPQTAESQLAGRNPLTSSGPWQTVFRDDFFDEIVCIHALSRIGFAAESGDQKNVPDVSAYIDAITEFRRLLRPGGRLALTVPFGCRQTLESMQQFDINAIKEIQSAFGGIRTEEDFFRRTYRGWVRAAHSKCAGAEYDADGAAAVACLTFEKPRRETVFAAIGRARKEDPLAAPTVSVVIGSYSRAALLQHSIQCVRENLRDIPHEIIVVDGGSEDGAVEWLSSQRDVILILQHNRIVRDGRRIARRSWGYFTNLGFKVAQGEYVLMMSDDCLLLPHAVTNALKSARVQRKSGRKLGGVAFYFRNWPQERDYYVQLTLGNLMMVNHGLFLRAALEDVNWVDEESFRFYKADGDLSLRLWAAGYEIIGCNEALVEHYMDPAEELRSTNNEVLDADRDAYKNIWRGTFYRSNELDLGGRVLHSYTDPENTAERVFGAFRDRKDAKGAARK